MDPDRQQRIIELCDSALERNQSDRQVFLSGACGADEVLRRDVEALLAYAADSRGLLAVPVAEIAGQILGRTHLPSLVGRQLGSYQILTLLGTGGMGDVYRARDTQLERDVAIKVLPEFLASDEERIARFDREARVLATLNHPHIGAIYGLLEADGVRGLVLELVEGTNLAERLRSGPLPIHEALGVARQIADALAAAHAKGIVHRDLKPANVTVSRDGTVKVLDFGLAKVAPIAETVGDPLQSATASLARTRAGVILGTVAYMSPEQARGNPVDKRSDIWSFGCVLYELLTAQRAIAGETVTDTLVAILEREPDWRALPKGTPASVRRLLQRCFEKDPGQRLRDIGDARLDLDEALAIGVYSGETERKRADAEVLPPAHPARPLPTMRIFRRRPWIAASALVVAVAAALLWRARVTGVEESPIRSIAVLPLQNLSQDPDQEFFSDGTTEALIAGLAQIHTLNVISRTSVTSYKKTTKSLRDIGRELGVDAIVEGSVQRANGRIRITAQLIRTSTDTHLWAGAYERDVTDVLKLEADAALAIAEQIHAVVTPDESRRLRNARPVVPAAHEEFLLGRHVFLSPGDATAAKSATEHFRRAVALQADHAGAWAGLAEALAFTGDRTAARMAVERALQLDPDLAEAHNVVAGLAMDEYDWQRAEREFQRALELNPNSMDTCACYSSFLRITNRFPQALALITRAGATDPLSSAVQAEYGSVLYMSHKYEEAVPHYQRAIELNARNRLAYFMFALTYQQLGKPQEGVALLDRPEFQPSAELGLAYASVGRRQEALNMVARLEKLASPDAVVIAALFFALEERDEGFRWLTRAVDERQIRARFLNVWPLFDPVRADPRFMALVKRLKLPA